jgi:hypothetical protein
MLIPEVDKRLHRLDYGATSLRAFMVGVERDDQEKGQSALGSNKSWCERPAGRL